MAEWHDFKQGRQEHTVVGDLRVANDVYSPQLDNRRNIYAWLPESYGQGQRRYPVLYMHDGQNLFDVPTSYAGEWQVDETMTSLASEGYEAIIVGIEHGEQRMIELSPYTDTRIFQNVGRGEDYMRFIVETVKPMIDADFRTLPDAANTGIAGSSMGGLISLYGFLTYPGVFNYCGAFSTAFWFGDSGLLKTIAARADRRGKIYLDVGTGEGATLRYLPGGDDEKHSVYVQGVRHLRDALRAHGYTDDTLRYVEEEGGIHHESAWARRLPDALRFLLPRP